MVEIKYVQIYGERCSGTNYLEQLINKNFNLQIRWAFGWKHWHSFSQFPKFEYDLDEWLFLVIYRNPLDWLRSLYRQQHHFPDSIKTLNFSDFLRNQWWSVFKGQEHMSDRNPLTQERYKNILKMRGGKHHNYLELKNKVKNVYYINYDLLNLDRRKIIRDISHTFKIPLRKGFVDQITSYKGLGKIKYIKTKYDSISEDDLNFIKEELDLELEIYLGYEL